MKLCCVNSPHCNVILNMGNRHSHEQVCGYKLVKCPVPTCTANVHRQELAQHCIDTGAAHIEDLLRICLGEVLLTPATTVDATTSIENTPDASNVVEEVEGDLFGAGLFGDDGEY